MSKDLSGIILDDFNREGLAIEVDFSLPAERVVRTLNQLIERYNRTVRYDWLSQYLFESIAEVQLHATQWLWTYNNERPNAAIGGITPRQKLALVA